MIATQPLPQRTDRHTPPVSAPLMSAPLIGRKAFVAMIMGMPISLHVRAEDPARADIAAAAENVFALLRKVDDLFSMWREDSEIRRIQSGLLPVGAGHDWQGDVLALALEAEERTDGLFSAWYAARPAPVPTSAPAAAGGRWYDPTGLVKGWAVEQAAQLLRVVPRISFCLSAGGDMVVDVGRGMTGIAPAWRIGIESPSVPGSVTAVRSVRTGAIATSGAAARGAHIVDPRSAAPIDRPGSATVVGPSLVWADVWATAAFVDPERAATLMATRAPGYELILRP